MIKQTFNLLLACFVAMILVVQGVAQDDAPGELGIPDFQTPKAWQDRVFNRHVSVKLLAKAVNKEDPQLLTDVAMEFLEAERILRRSHHSVSAEQIFQIALRVATDHQDTKSVDRLAAAAKEAKKQKLALLAENSAKIAAKPRAANSSTKIQADSAPIEQINQYAAVLHDIRQATLFGQGDRLLDLKKFVQAECNGLAEEQRQQLVKLADVGSQAGSSTSSDALATLSASARYPSGISRLGAYFHLCEDGVHLRSIIPGSEAAKIGLVAGDHIVSLNGTRFDVFNASDYSWRSALASADIWRLRILKHDGHTETKTISGLHHGHPGHPGHPNIPVTAQSFWKGTWKGTNSTGFYKLKLRPNGTGTSERYDAVGQRTHSNEFKWDGTAPSPGINAEGSFRMTTRTSPHTKVAGTFVASNTGSPLFHTKVTVTLGSSSPFSMTKTP